jgi:hypothetical protein
MDSFGTLLIVYTIAHASFVIYMLIHHPKAMFIWRAKAQKKQDELMNAAGKVAKTAARTGIAIGLRQLRK